MSGQQYQIRGDTRANLAAVTPAAKEIFAVTDKLGEMGIGSGAALASDNKLLLKRKGHHESLSPAQITSNQNDYSPSGLAYAETLFLNTDAARSITGIAGGDTDRFLNVVNIGSFNITLVDASGSSTAANRFSFGADLIVRPKQGIILVYSAASSRWLALSDAFMWKSVTDLPENLTLSGDLTPAQITANQNDYNPSGLSLATVLRLNTDASRNITGIAGGADGRVLKLLNVNTNPIVLTNADINSTAANRFDIGANITLAAKQSISLWYDATDSRWKMFANTAGAAVADGAVTAVKLATSAAAFGIPMVNGTLVASVAANALTIAIKTLAGTDPSAADPVYVLVRSATASSGSYSVMTLTAATSFVISSGSSMGAVNATAFKLWVVGFNDAGTFRLGAINCWDGTNIIQLDEWNLQSATSEGGAGAADVAGVYYAGATVTTKPLRVLGFMEWSTGLTTAGTWNAGPDTIALAAHGIKRPGDTVQTRSATTTSVTTNSTTSYTDTTLTKSITPRNASNVIACNVNGQIGTNDANNAGIIALHRGGSLVGNPQYIFTAAAAAITPAALAFIDTPFSVSALTYTLRIKSQTGTKAVYFPDSTFAGAGTLQLTELMT